MSLNSLVSGYRRLLQDKTSKNKEINVELEVRFKTSKTIFNELLKNLKAKQISVSDEKVSNLLDVIISDKTSNRIKQVNIDTKSKTYTKKTRLYKQKINGTISYFVAVSVEEPIPEFKINGNDVIIRRKIRHSFIFENSWQVDMTMVMTMTKDEIKDLNQPINENLCSYEIEFEFIDKNRDTITPTMITSFANKIIGAINPNIVDTSESKIVFDNVAQALSNKTGTSTLRSLLPKVIALTHGIYSEIYPPIGYHLTDKTDGIRALGVIHDDRAYILADNKLIKSSIMEQTALTIVDGEFLEKTNTLYVFDCMFDGGVSLLNLRFTDRIKHIQSCIDKLSMFNLKCESKHYEVIRLNNIEEIEKSVKSVMDRPYPIDGLILTEPNKAYFETKSYKWKDIAHSTLDFYSLLCPANWIGKSPYINKPDSKLYLLFSGIRMDVFEKLKLRKCPLYHELFENKYNQSPYFPIQFSPSTFPLAYLFYYTGSEDLNHKIIELSPNIENKEFLGWNFIRIRPDRHFENNYFGNDYPVAEITWYSYFDEFKLSEIWTGPVENYFVGIKSDIYQSQINCISKVKASLIREIAGNWVLDIGCGRGTDLGRFLNADVKNLISVDVDASALTELVRRKYEHLKHTNYKTNVIVMNMDVSKDANSNSEKINSYIYNQVGIDNIFINLMIHYMMGDEMNIQNLVKLCHKVSNDHTVIHIICMDGQKVMEFLDGVKEKESRDMFQNDILKYSIKRLYSSEELERIGQKIGILLPFSRGKLYEEYLVNLNYLGELFRDAGFEVKEIKHMDDYFQMYKEYNLSDYNNLTDDDKTYLKLYCHLKLAKV
ncbi:mRNA capping enzyme [uncultured archaeon]|nr:mRNA capping enzyme [uncultured archaeon]